MTLRFAHLTIAVLLAFTAGTGAAFAQALPDQDDSRRGDNAVLPIWNSASKKVEGFLLLEPTDGARTGARWRLGNNTLDAAFGLEAGDSLALLCNRQSGIANALGNLANNCVLGSVDDSTNDGSRRTSATAAFGRGGGRVGLTAGTGRDTLPAWLSGGRTGSGQVDVNDLTVFAQKNIGREGMVEIAGTMARARLLSPAEASSFGLSDQWSSKSLSIGGGYGAFGASIIGHVVDTPGQQKWEGLGLGITWRTPWSGQLTVGADNLVTRGKNPFSPSSATKQDEGAVPYVRYEQDL
jgi:hypothetical protein